MPVEKTVPFCQIGPVKKALDPDTGASKIAYDPDFRNQIKGRLLAKGILTQVVRESTLAHHEFLNRAGKPTRKLDKIQSQVAWNLSSAIYDKIGGRPWKLTGVREGVCYVGLAYKRDEEVVLSQRVARLRCS